MTEEDTFNKLRRPTFIEMRNLVQALAVASIANKVNGVQYISDRCNLLEEHHWSEDEYEEYFER